MAKHMTGPDHYREAQRLLGMQVSTDPEDQGAVIALHLAAQVHATLALTAATVEAADEIAEVHERGHSRALIIRPTKGDEVDPAHPGSPWGRALYGGGQ